jgi:hypothetical protein
LGFGLRERGGPDEERMKGKFGLGGDCEDWARVREDWIFVRLGFGKSVDSMMGS